MKFWLWCFVPAILLFVAEVYILKNVEKKKMRFLPPLSSLFPFLIAAIAYCGEDPGLDVGLNELVAMLWTIVGVVWLLACGLAWLVVWLKGRKKQEK